MKLFKIKAQRTIENGFQVLAESEEEAARIATAIINAPFAPAPEWSATDWVVTANAETNTGAYKVTVPENASFRECYMIVRPDGSAVEAEMVGEG